MRDWLRSFFSETAEEIKLTFQGQQTFKKSDCHRVGGGSEKHVFKIKDSNVCFFIPNKWRSEEDWDEKIKAEKFLLDQIRSYGLKTQEFEIVPLEVQEANKPAYTINVLVARDFESLCEEEALVIYNEKGEYHDNRDQKVIGQVPDFMEMRDKFKDPIFVRTMFAKIIKEYAIALTFQLPISILGSCDDSEHFCFELPKDQAEPPVIRYMFWDVVSDFGGVKLPTVPTLADLKSGCRNDDAPLRGLNRLANAVSCAIYYMNRKKIKMSDFSFVRPLEKEIANALNDDEFLKQALEDVRILAVKDLNKFLESAQISLPDPFDGYTFALMMQCAISSDDLSLVQQFFAFHSKLTAISEPTINTIMNVAKKYGNLSIIEYLESNLDSLKSKVQIHKPSIGPVASEEEVLKVKFFENYEAKLTQDKSALCGLYSFFAKSYVNKELSLQELITHAQGRSLHGSGKRSLEVMKTMGWLDEEGRVTAEISDTVSLNSHVYK